MIDFPSVPAVGDKHTAAGITFQWNGNAWNANQPPAAGLKDAPTDGKLYARKSAAWSAVDLVALGIPNHDKLLVDVSQPTFSRFMFAPGRAGNLGLVLNTLGTVSSDVPYIGAQKGGLQRWQVNMGENAESGSNVGSDYAIYRYNDAGVTLGPTIGIKRSTGTVTIYGPTGGLVVQGTDGIQSSGPIAAGTKNVTAASGMGFVFDGASSNFLWMGASSNNWSWQWNRSNGNLAWLGSSGGGIFNIAGTGAVSASVYTASSAQGIGVGGTSTDGSSYYLQSLVVGNPNWGTLDFRSRHQLGQWAGYEMVAGNGTQIRYSMSSGQSWGSIQALSFEVQSDERTKRDIAPVYAALDVIDGMQAHTFEHIPLARAADDDMPIYPQARRAGTMAQDWLHRLPEAVTDSGDGNLMLDYAAIAAVTAQAVSELLARVRYLETELQTLKGATP